MTRDDEFCRFCKTELGIEDDLSLSLQSFYRPIAELLIRLRYDLDRVPVIGVSGGQGSGKTTIARILTYLLESEANSVAAFSIDDCYLPWKDRQQLQRQQQGNPYYQISRGNPGTHDVALAREVIHSLQTATPTTGTLIPRFAKGLHNGKGDRLPREQWPRFVGRPDLIVFDGWFVGSPYLEPQQITNLKQGVPELSAFEALVDPDGSYGLTVNDRLLEYQPLFASIDYLLYLRVPSLAKVLDWRLKQERQLRSSGAGGMTDEEVTEFVKPYYLLTAVHGLKVLADCRSGISDLILEIGEDQRPLSLIECQP